jgi:hypothetical protein
MVASKPKLKAPFPAIGGKSRTAKEVWSRFGNVRNYIEPFCFSAANLLLRPAAKDGEPHRIETINDANAYVANFWRAISADPDAVADAMDWPVNEVDLHARHNWLVTSHEARQNLTRVREDPKFYDVTIAGWWCWGSCMWIGAGWCDTPTKDPLDGGVRYGGRRRTLPQQKPGNIVGVFAVPQQVPTNGSGKGIHGKRPSTGKKHGGVGMLVPEGGRSLWKKRPILDGGARGALSMDGKPPDTHRPQIADAYSRGRGVHGNDSAEERAARRAWLREWCNALADRLRPVRVCCGNWSRVCDSPSVLTRLGLTGVFLDPPYAPNIDRMLAWFAHLADPKNVPAPGAGNGKGTNRAAGLYANDRAQDVDRMVAEVAAWCVKWGDTRDLRIAVCGLEGEYPMLESRGWVKFAWKSLGYGLRGKVGNANATRERIWFNKNCISPEANKTLWDLVVPQPEQEKQCRSTKRSSPRSGGSSRTARGMKSPTSGGSATRKRGESSKGITRAVTRG